MTDEIALLLTLLDRPCEAEGNADARLIYADWLEDNGQDDLAEWLRLHAVLPRLASGDRRRRHQEARLRELRQTHRNDWVEIGGVLLTWESALLLFRFRLAETVAWCTERDYKVLRSRELMPQLGCNVSGIEPLWRCRRAGERVHLVHQLGKRRAIELGKTGISPTAPARDLAGGRLLLFDPDGPLGESRGAPTSGGFFDAYLTPAWDTWIGYFDDGAEGHRRAHCHWEAEWIMRRRIVPVPYPSYLVAWVPPALVAAVEWSRNLGARASMDWAENVDCELSVRLRELGWFPAPDRHKVAGRQEQRIGFAREPQGKRGLPNP